MRMNEDGSIIGFGVEGVQFTDFPAAPQQAPLTMGKIEFGRATIGAERNFQNEQPKLQGVILPESLQGRTVHVLNQDQLDQIANYFGLAKWDRNAAQEEPVHDELPEEMKGLTTRERHAVERAVKRITEATEGQFLPVRHGWVKRGDSIWWRCDLGPELVVADDREGCWDNITRFPNRYQHTKPNWDSTNRCYID